METFTCDFLDRLTAVSGLYTQSYAYNQIGNITSMNGTSYTDTYFKEPDTLNMSSPYNLKLILNVLDIVH
jgi:hypothetical protein